MLELRDVSFEVKDMDGMPKSIIKNINFSVDDCKFIVITGPNGSGKSTLAKLIVGIESPTSGKIILDGIDITTKNITERAHLGLGFAFQQPVRFKGLRVLDLLRLAAHKELSLSDACNYLAEVGLCAKDYISREINASLSGGELKRIEIAMLLARKPRLAIFDEPEAGIDLWSFSNLIRIFTSLRDTIKDNSIIIISHQERILNLADEIILLNNGEIQKKGCRAEILTELISADTTMNCCHKIT